MGSSRSKYVPFFASFYEQGRLMSKRARMQFYDAIITYRFEGTEPEGLCKEAQLAWIGARPILEKSRSESARKTATGESQGESLGYRQGARQGESLGKRQGEHSPSYRKKEKG